MDNQLSELSLVDLLHAHSDIDTKSLCSLACVSTGFKTAVDSIWAARSVDYRRRVLARPRPPPHVPVWTGKYLWESDYHVEKDASGKASLRFIFSGVWGGSKHAWLSSVQARRDFLLDTGDLNLLQRYSVGKQTFYEFEEVVAAGFGKFGSPAAYLSRLLGRLQKRVERLDKRLARHAALRAMLSREFLVAPPDEALNRYAAEYIRSGRGGLRRVRDSCRRHFAFARLVEAASGGLLPFLRDYELHEVRHLWQRYALDADPTMLNMAIEALGRARYGY